MKIAPPANKAERRALQERLEREHGRRVDVLKNHWGWYARFFKTAPLRKTTGPDRKEPLGRVFSEIVTSSGPPEPWD